MDQEEQVILDNKEKSNEIATESQPQETQEQINWKKFREQREIERKQKEAADKKAAEKEAEVQALKQAMDAILNKQAPIRNQQVQDSYYQEPEESEDERIQKKIEAALLVREKQFEEERKHREHAEYPQRLVSNFKDFNEICNVENLDYLEYHYPEIAGVFKDIPDGYNKWASVYAAVKRFVPNTNSLKDQKKAEKNFNKPQSMSVPGVTQTGDSAPIQLDEKRRADNWSRMQKVMKGGR